MSIQERVFHLLEVDAHGWVWSKVVDFAVVVMVLLNVSAVIVETVPGVRTDENAFYFDAFERFSLCFFITEYLLRLWVAPFKPKFKGKVKGRIKWILSPLPMVEFLAIFPGLFGGFGLGIDFRSFRVFRLFKLFQYSKRLNKSLLIFQEAIILRRDQLLISVGLILMLIVSISTIMYFIEHDAQPEAFASIPHTLWWSVATLSTVGYGDVYPITIGGKVLGGIVALLGVGLFALPAGILSSAFVDSIEEMKGSKKEKSDS